MFGPTHRNPLARALVAAALAAGALITLALGACTPSERRQVVARVNDLTITTDDLLRELRRSRGPATLVEMIDAELIRQGAEEAGITVAGDELELRMERAMAQAGSEADLEAMLKRRNLTREQFREMLLIDLQLDKLARASMTIDEQEIKDFYAEHREDYAVGAQVKARMMLLGSEADARAILDTLKAGGDFAGLASALSLDPATRDRGGDMGWFERKDYARPIADAAFSLQCGELSEPIEAPDGWVILLVEERRDAGYRPLEEVRDEVRGRIDRAKLPSAREEWIKAARRRATVRITDPELRAATRRILENAPAPEPVSLLPIPPPQ